MIRNATLKDLEILAALNEDVQNLHHAAVPGIFKPFNKKATLALFRQIIRKRNFKFLLEFLGGEPRGYALIEIKKHKNTAFVRAYSAVYIHHIAVGKKHHNAGVGKSLIEEIKSTAARSKIKRIELDVWDFNGSAKKFFGGRGFHVYNEKMYLEL
jgi:ribosomal protein S18 acetylase RimI-like enzyme